MTLPKSVIGDAYVQKMYSSHLYLNGIDAIGLEKLWINIMVDTHFRDDIVSIPTR